MFGYVAMSYKDSDCEESVMTHCDYAI